MRLFIVGTENAVDAKMIRTALDGMLVMHEREAESEQMRTMNGRTDPMVIITAGRDGGVDYHVHQWHHWHRQSEAVTLLSLEHWWTAGDKQTAHRDVVNAAFMLEPDHLIAFYSDTPGDLSDYDRHAYALAAQFNIPTWTFTGSANQQR